MVGGVEVFFTLHVLAHVTTRWVWVQYLPLSLSLLDIVCQWDLGTADLLLVDTAQQSHLQEFEANGCTAVLFS